MAQPNIGSAAEKTVKSVSKIRKSAPVKELKPKVGPPPNPPQRTTSRLSSERIVGANEKPSRQDIPPELPKKTTQRSGLAQPKSTKTVENSDSKLRYGDKNSNRQKTTTDKNRQIVTLNFLFFSGRF